MNSSKAFGQNDGNFQFLPIQPSTIKNLNKT